MQFAILQVSKAPQPSKLHATLASRLTRTFCLLSGKVLNEQASVTF
jgi:hypothetical protein